MSAKLCAWRLVIWFVFAMVLAGVVVLPLAAAQLHDLLLP